MLQKNTFLFLFPFLFFACKGENKEESTLNPIHEIVQEVEENVMDEILDDPVKLEVSETITIGETEFALSVLDEHAVYDPSFFGDEKETYYIDNDPNVRRKENQLIFKLENGNEQILTSIPQNENEDENENDNYLEVVNYSFFGTLENSNLWIVLAMGYEHFFTVIINKTTGEKTITIGQCTVSPNGEYLLSYNVDLEAAYTTNGFELFTIENNTLKSLGILELEDWGPSKANWQTDSTLLLTKAWLGTAEQNYENYYSLLEMKLVK